MTVIKPSNPVYCIDSSSLMDWQARYYPSDVFVRLVDQIDSLIEDGRLLAPALVSEEIGSIGTAGMIEWIRKRKKIIVSTDTIFGEALQIQNQFTGLRDPKAEHEEADSHVIALAKLRQGIVVTQETSASEKRNPKRTHYIPDVCRELGLTCISFLGLMRRENWKF
jgi:hypothetical protein